MSVKERVRLEAFGRVKRGELTVVGAAELLGLSLRQSRRVWKRFSELGGGLMTPPWVPLFTPRFSDFVSARVGNYEVNTYASSTALLDQLWVR